MLGLIVFSALVWLVLQTAHPKRQLKWASRIDAPFPQKVWSDAKYVGRRVRAHVMFRRARRNGEWDITEVL